MRPTSRCLKNRTAGSYQTAEHWMMAEQARLFGDHEMLAAIIESKTPRDAKAFGRRVREQLRSVR